MTDHLLLTVPEACEFLRISRNTLYRRVEERAIPHVRLGRKILFPRHALEQWLEASAARGVQELAVPDALPATIRVGYHASPLAGFGHDLRR